jgi:hypothetical protein
MLLEVAVQQVLFQVVCKLCLMSHSQQVETMATPTIAVVLIIVTIPHRKLMVSYTLLKAGPPAQPMQGMVPGQPLTQQIFIPNDMVGAIIGKGGAKINEIRQLSGSVIKINEPQDNSNERLVTITGTAECNQMALYMLYSRLGKILPLPPPDITNNFAESEKHRI